MAKRISVGVILAIVVWVLLGATSAFLALMSPMMFDAPGSTENRYLVEAFYGVLGLPIAFLTGAALVGFMPSLRWRLLVLALPAIPIALIAHGFTMISRVCGGNFGCPSA